ncbi:MAG: PilT/PilU family type 4a pilus ATPase [Deltaproteobacteria bacterium]|nr:PilT/PilU family type 4a pilus ATPase [Deltaproteobacteria bacterium]
MVTIDDILRHAIDREASDIHLKVGAPPFLRRFGHLGPEDAFPALAEDDIRDVIRQITDEKQRERLDNDRQLDLGYGNDAVGRFRVSVYHQRGELRVAMRSIPKNIRSLDQLQLPKIVETLAKESRGLILVTGTTGSGKSTTLASMIDLLNQTEALHMITVEDPIEYLHDDKLSIISQREVGVDVTSFGAGLKGALRQDPDVILVGEMRDLETIETAIMSAETGHLVMSTLHTLDAPETVTRVIQAFPDHQREQIRIVLSSVLKGIISQRLVPKADGNGLVPAVEIMVSTGLVRDIIKDPQRSPREITDALAKGHVSYGTQTFDQSLMALFRKNLITYDEALRQATNPDDFALQVSGISSTSNARWDDFDSAAEPRSGIGENAAASAEAAGGGNAFGQPRPPAERPAAKPAAVMPRLVKRF